MMPRELRCSSPMEVISASSSAQPLRVPNWSTRVPRMRKRSTRILLLLWITREKRSSDKKKFTISFAECSRHSAKFKKHSANILPSVTLDKVHTAKKKWQRTLCRVSFIGQSAKSLRSTAPTLGKAKLP